MEGFIMKTMKRIACFVMIIAMVSAVFSNKIEAVTKVNLNKKKVTLTITNSKKNPTTTLKVKGVSKKLAKKAKWTSSNKSVATVKKGKVAAKSAGKVTITCKVTSKKATCKVTVVDKRTDSKALNITVVEKASDSGLCPELPTREFMMKKAAELGLNPGPSNDVKCGPGPYTVNKIMVTYDGKDVTNKVKYEIDDLKIAFVTSPGVINVTNNGYFFNLTVSYKSEKRTFRMKKVQTKAWYFACYCGEPFTIADGTALSNHMSEMRHGGNWLIPFCNAIDITMAATQK